MCYTNPHDGIEALGRRFFRRCLALRLRPCVVTKRTVFKWQETFWQRLRALFEREFRPAFVQARLLGAEEELSQAKHWDRLCPAPDLTLPSPSYYDELLAVWEQRYAEDRQAGRSTGQACNPF